MLVLLLAGTAAIWQRSSAPLRHDRARYHNRQFTCTRVVDGDTIDIDAADGRSPSTRIRLWGVDTPETARDNKAAMHFGPQAKAFVAEHVEDRPVRIILADTQTRGKYGRLLAYVYYGSPETMLNEELLRRGLAYADTRFKHPWRSRFRHLETKARKDQRGLWKDVTPAQMPGWRQRYEQWRDDQRRPR